AGSRDVRFKPAVTRPRAAGGEAREAGEAGIGERGVGQCYRATSALRRVCGDEIVRISGRARAEHSANSEERNRNGILKPSVRIGRNLTFERWITAVGVEHSSRSRTKALGADCSPDARACAA